MFDENQFKDDLLSSLNDEIVPNKANKIKTIYADRLAQQNKPFYKYRRLYLIGIPALCASLAVAVIVPVLSKQRTIKPQYLNTEEGRVVDKVDTLGSDNQLSMSFEFLGNAVKTLTNDLLPTENVGNSSFTTVKNLYVLNSYMYTFEKYLNKGFDQIYSIDSDEDSSYKYTMNYMDSNIYTEYNEVLKTTYNGEQNYSFDGILKYKNTDDEFIVKGEKNGLFGIYTSNNRIFIDDEMNKGFNVSFVSDILGSQKIHLQEFVNSNVLSDITLSCYTSTLKDDVTYYIEASIDGFTFIVDRINDTTLNIKIESKNTSDTILVNIIDVDGKSKYEYVNPGLKIDFTLPRM